MRKADPANNIFWPVLFRRFLFLVHTLSVDPSSDTEYFTFGPSDEAESQSAEPIHLQSRITEQDMG